MDIAWCFQSGLWYERGAKAYQEKKNNAFLTRKIRMYKVENKEGIVTQETMATKKKPSPLHEDNRKDVSRASKAKGASFCVFKA